MNKILFADVKPNFLTIVSESHPTSTLSCYQGLYKKVNPTPNLCRIAEKSFLFTSAFCVNANTASSSASFLTGKHSHINGFKKVEKTFDYSHESLPKLLQESGYETALFGRWDFNNNPMYFDHWNILADSSEKYNPEFRNSHRSKRIEGYSTDIITDLAIKWLNDRKKQEPYFLLIQFNATTAPWMPAIRHLNLYDDQLLPEPANLFDNYTTKASPSRYQSMRIKDDLNSTEDLFFQIETAQERNSTTLTKSKSKKNLELMTDEQFSAWTLSWRPTNEAFIRETQTDQTILQWKFQRFAKNFLRCLCGIDENIKRIEDTLSESKTENTFLIYTANHGKFLGEHGWYGNNWMYEESLRIPLMINTKFTKSIPKSVKVLTQNIDLAPTILEYANAERFVKCHGESLSRWLQNSDNNNTWRDTIYYHFDQFPNKQMVAKHYGIRNNQYKLIHFYQFDEWELYDLKNDPMEDKNLYNNQLNSSQVEYLKKAMQALRNKYSDSTDISIMPEEWRKFYRGPEARNK